ncbi:hypothetical protein TNCV_2611761 [Trichonephila clavipes]|nr:hypothetical protein TNCV_2611761 [Trichonephila clavipes]
MPRVKRRNYSSQMNSKRWYSDSVNTCVTEENILDPNIRIKQLLSTKKTGHSEVGNYIIVNFEQINKMFMKLKCLDCDKQTLKLALGNKVGFSYMLNLTCSSSAEKVCAVETSNERQGNTVPDINLRITQAFSNIGADSWGFYQSAEAKGQKPGLRKQHVGTPINESFLPHILSIYERLASNELL